MYCLSDTSGRHCDPVRRRLAAILACTVLAAGCGTTAKHARSGKTPAGPGKPERSRKNRAEIRVGGSPASKRCAALLPLIEKAAGEAGIETAMLVGIVRTESNFRNDVRSSVGARGLTQVMKATARAKKCGDLADPYENLKCGARVFAAFMAYYQDDVILALSGYNAGHAMPNAARRDRNLPANIGYVETVLWARARFLRRGCDY